MVICGLSPKAQYNFFGTIITIAYLYMFLELQKTLLENHRSFPTSKDLYASGRAILRIQDAYNISAQVIADGDLLPGKKSLELWADECFELGYINSELEYFEQVREWMGETWKRMSLPYTYSGLLVKAHVLEHLAWAEYQVSGGNKINKNGF